MYDGRSPMDFKKKALMLVASLMLVLSSMVAFTSGPSSAVGTVYNYYECYPSTGWCYQVNPPYNSSIPRSCRWNYTIPYQNSGMYYTGCTAGYWRPEVH